MLKKLFLIYKTILLLVTVFLLFLAFYRLIINDFWYHERVELFCIWIFVVSLLIFVRVSKILIFFLILHIINICYYMEVCKKLISFIIFLNITEFFSNLQNIHLVIILFLIFSMEWGFYLYRYNYKITLIIITAFEAIIALVNIPLNILFNYYITIIQSNISCEIITPNSTVTIITALIAFFLIFFFLKFNTFLIKKKNTQNQQYISEKLLRIQRFTKAYKKPLHWSHFRKKNKSKPVFKVKNIYINNA